MSLDPLLVRELETQPPLLQGRVEEPLRLGVRPQQESVLAEPVDPDHLLAAGQVVARGVRHRVPDRLPGVDLRVVEGVVEPVGAQPHPRRAPVDGLVVALQQAGAAGELGRDVGDVARVHHRVHHRLAHRPALPVPELLDELGRADAHELEALQIGRVREQVVGHPVRLVQRVGERDDERKLRHPFRHLAGVERGDRRIRPVVDPHSPGASGAATSRAPASERATGGGRGRALATRGSSRRAAPSSGRHCGCRGVGPTPGGSSG